MAAKIYIDKTLTTDGPSCPFCASEELSMSWKYDGVKVHCDECFALGPVSNTWQGAVRAWTERMGK